MKIEPKKMEDMCCGSEAQYPYGTRIEIEGDLAVGLGFDKMKAGDYVEVRGIAFVTRKSESADADDAAEGESDKNMCLQLVEIDLKKVQSDRVKQLYGSESD